MKFYHKCLKIGAKPEKMLKIALKKSQKIKKSLKAENQKSKDFVRDAGTNVTWEVI